VFKTSRRLFFISMDSDAVFHEKSEYAIRFKIRMTYEELSSIFRKKCSLFFAKNAKMPKKYLTCIFINIGSSYRKFITIMISAKNSTNPESFNEFGHGHRINLAISHGISHESLFRENRININGHNFLNFLLCS